MHVPDGPERQWHPAPDPRPAVRSAENARPDGSSAAMLLGLQRSVGNAPVTAVVQRLQRQGATAKVALKKKPDEFLFALVQAIGVAHPPATFTNAGVTYDVQDGDLKAAKEALWEHQLALKKAKGEKSPYKSYDDYMARKQQWREKLAAKDPVALADGSFIYHGTSRAVGLIVRGSGLGPAQPSFRGGMWDASKDGFLSMATGLGGVTVTADSIVLRMTIQAGDNDHWQWRKAGGADEIVSVLPIPANRLEWSADHTTWQPMTALT